MPELALLTMVFLFGFYAIVDGVFNISAACRRGGRESGTRWWAKLISKIAGALASLWPGLTAWRCSS